MFLTTTEYPAKPVHFCHSTNNKKHILFVCFGFSSHSRIFHSYGDVSIADEGLHISWPLSSEGSLACHIYCDTLYNGHLREPVTLTPISERLSVELSLFLRLRSVAAEIRKPTFRLQGERSSPLRHRRCRAHFKHV